MGPPVSLANLSPPLPFQEPPETGCAIEVAPGLLWLRLPLPLRLNHVNVYLIADGEGWTLVDTGAGDEPTQAIWTALLGQGPGGVLDGKPITRIVASHHHPDHVGGAAALCRLTGAPLTMGHTEYLTALLLTIGDESALRPSQIAFYKKHGLDAAYLDMIGGHRARYQRLVPDLPKQFTPLVAGETLAIGRRRFAVLDMPGHSPAQIILHEPQDNILLVADHVLTRISPNISVTDRNPDDDPLGRYLASLARLRGVVPDGGLVLPGHHLPFRHLHARTFELEAHHEERCGVIERATHSGKGLTAAELVPILFPFPLDAHQFWFAFTEALAHANHLGRLGRLEPRESHGRRRWGAPGRPSHAG